MAINNDILESLKVPSKFIQLRTRMEEQEILEDYKVEILETADEVLETNDGELILTKLEEDNISDLEFVDQAKWEEAQEGAIDFFNGEWNLEAVKLALASYLAQGYKVETITTEGDEDTAEEMVTHGALWMLEEDNEEYAAESKLSTAARKKLPSSAFCGPNRSFPVHDKAHAVAALRLIGRYKGGDKERIRKCIMRKASKFGVGQKSESEVLELYPIFVENGESRFFPIAISSTEEVQHLIEAKDEIVAKYFLSGDQVEAFGKFLNEISEVATIIFAEEFKVVPLFENEGLNTECIELSVDSLCQYFQKRESDTSQKQYLAPLVGIIKTEGLGKDTVETASSTYGKYSLSVLEVFYNRIPEKKVEDVKVGDQVTPVTDPVAEDPTKNTESTSKRKSKSNSDSIGLFWRNSTPAKETRSSTKENK